MILNARLALARAMSTGLGEKMKRLCWLSLLAANTPRSRTPTGR
jgi:hypothetical protein